MKIAMVGDLPPHGGGVGSHVYLLSKKLIEKGHEVFAITYYHKNLKKIKGLHVSEIKLIDKPLIRPLMFAIKAKTKLQEIVEKEDIDIIHGHTLLGAGIPAVYVGDKYNIPTYVTAHGDDILRYYKKNILMKKLVERTLKKADKVLAVSNKVKNEIIRSNVENIQEKTSLHLNAVDTDKFKQIPHKPREKPTLISVSGLGGRKNIKLLLDAKKQSQTDFNLIIVGDGPERNSLENKVKKENITNVKFMGFREDVENILPHADLFVLPSTHEAFGIAYIEALACGLPVIGCNDSGAKEIITPNVGLLIKPNNLKSLTQAIDKILKDKKLYNKLQSHARIHAMKFSQMKIPYQELK